jgi:heavy metal translocating P-type ATPase
MTTLNQSNLTPENKPIEPSLWINGVFLGLSSIAIGLSLILRTVQTSVYGIPIQEIPLLIGIVGGGLPLIFQILSKIFQGNFGADLLAAIAIVTAVVLDQYLAANLIILMLSGGQVLENDAMRRASSVLLLLAKRMPSSVHLKKESLNAKGISRFVVEDIPLSQVQIGDFVLVYPFEVCPVDGIVREGRGVMDESYLTGEPYHVPKAPGVQVLSGAINGQTPVTVEVTSQPSDSRYAKIMRVMEESEQKRPKMRRLADQLGAVFAPVALSFALIVWIVTGDPLRFLSVLVIATPCPLLIAIPITIISTISLAAKRGIIIKDPALLEGLPLCRTAIFDKTGTLTYGKAELVENIPLSPFDKNDVLQLAASIESFSRHPLSLAVVKEADKLGLKLLEATDISERPGEGLSGTVHNRFVQITSRKKFLQEFSGRGPQLPPTQPGLECLVLIDHQLAGVFIFRDTLRAEGGAFIRHLSPMHGFNKVMILSGDRSSEVDYLAQELGVKEAFANQSPEEKVDLVRRETQHAPTLFVGDGINDAPALAAATVGIAFGRESITAEAAGAVILESSLLKVDELFHMSSLMRKIALQSALGGMALSLIGMGFAAGGMISPVMGAILQEVIDVFAILNALRLTWFPTALTDIDEHASENG